MFRPDVFAAVLALTFSLPVFAQQGESQRALQPQGSNPPEPQNKRIFGIIPNYRTYPTLSDYQPITAEEKFKIATQDAFDRGTFVMAGLFAAKAQVSNSTPSFGQGVAGFARYYGTADCDLITGDYMTEAIFPALLHQDPRYFRRGTGSALARLGSAMGQIFWTRTDAGGHMFNFSEIGGNAAATAMGNAYYPENRNAADKASRLGIAVGIDMASNIVKEFYPDLLRALSRKHRTETPGTGR